MEPLSFLEVLEEEDRALSGVKEPSASSNADLFSRLHGRERSALCFSGGGIRSATFGLGILQGLAAFSKKNDNGERPALLGEFDFLSTVSGGGYLGGWFSAWAARAGQGDRSRVRSCSAETLGDGPARVIEELSAAPDASFEPEPEPVKHLRDYTNYLTPRTGLLSADTWALASIVTRNILLNWLVLIPLFLAVLLLPILAWNLVDLDSSQVSAAALWFIFFTALATGGLATAYIGYDLPNAGNQRRSTNVFLVASLLPISVSAIQFNIFWAWLPQGDPSASFWKIVALGKVGLHWMHFALLGAIMHGGGMLAGILYVTFHYGRPPRKTGLVATLGATLTGTLAGLAGHGLSHLPDYSAAGHLIHHRVYTVLAFPTVMGLFLLAGTLLVGVTSYVTEDEDREWWARAGGWYLAVAGGWMVFSALVLYAATVLNFMNMQLSAAFTALTGFSGWTAARLGASSRTESGRSKEDRPIAQLPYKSFLSELFARIALPLFLVLLTMLLAMANLQLLRWMKTWPDVVPSVWPSLLKAPGDATAHGLWLALFYVVFGLLWSGVVNVNKFSLHGMYRQRLIRAYLGASNKMRAPNLFTGFDDNDNVPMCALSPHKPLHIVNMALNLVGGSNLAWQQRKAEPFTSSRLHTGSCRIGYRPSNDYGGRWGKKETRLPITLGTAITISGAAASPNMGYHSSPLLTIVMTLFNARLGWWLGNPRSGESVWKRPGPRIGLFPFVEEAFGMTDDTNDWIYLSDGGHFENLGLYEMVLRRCSFIVVSDAGADPLYQYEDLGNAVRKVRIDLGIPITFDRPAMPMTATGKVDSDFPGHHCAIGRIHYEAVDLGAPTGTLLYIKASLNGNEPADVRQYAASNKTFPHQPTSDQFFDESQFESYRRLGLHVIEEICGASGPVPPSLTLRDFKERAENYARGPVLRDSQAPGKEHEWAVA